MIKCSGQHTSGRVPGQDSSHEGVAKTALTLSVPEHPAGAWAFGVSGVMRADLPGT